MGDYTSDMGEIPEEALIVAPGDDGVDIHVDEHGIDVRFGDDEDATADGDFNANLAQRLEKEQRRRIADELIEAVKADEASREDWYERVTRAMELLGLKDRAKSEEPFPGASSVTHPLIGEAVVQFQSRALSEIVPAKGPVHTMVVGEQTEALEHQSERVRNYLNYRLMIDDGEWFDDTDQLLFYLPIGGSVFRKIFTDPVSGRTRARMVRAEDFIVPYTAKTLMGAPRYTHRFEMHINDIRRSIDAGTYADVALEWTHEQPENDEISDIADKRQPSFADGDDVRVLYEVHADYHLDIDEDADFDLPYIFTIDTVSGEILSIQRNWKEDDEKKLKRVWFAHYKFLPGIGFYGFGFLHMIGGLALAATGALRALLDAAARDNMSGGFKSKEARNATGDVTLEPGVWKDIDLTAEELAKAFYTPQHRGPSQALFELLGMLESGGRRFAGTTEALVGDAPTNAPVGTTVALIEQGSKVFSAIHRRIHRAAGAEYRLFAALDAANMGDAPYPYRVNGASGEIRATDFDARIDVLPVSDPNIFSATQRIALAQEVVKIVDSSPDVYGLKEKREAQRRLLDALRVPSVEAILPDAFEQRMDPVTENQYLLTGKGVKAYPQQDHAAHIKIHEALVAQMGQATGTQAEALRAAVMAHNAEHYAYAYRNRVQAHLGARLPEGMAPEHEYRSLPIAQENEIAMAVAQIAGHVQMPAEREAQAQQAAAQSQQQVKQAEAREKMQREAQSHAQKMAQAAQDFQAKQAREQAAFAAEQRRKYGDWVAGEHRDQAGWSADEQRKEQDWAAGERRDRLDWAADEQRKQAEWVAKTRRERSGGGSTQRQGEPANLNEALHNLRTSLDRGAKR